MRIQIRGGTPSKHDEHMCERCERGVQILQGTERRYYCHMLRTSITKPVLECSAFQHKGEESARNQYAEQFLVLDVDPITGDLVVRTNRHKLIPRHKWTSVPATPQPKQPDPDDEADNDEPDDEHSGGRTRRRHRAVNRRNPA